MLFFGLSFPHFHLISQSHSQSNPVYATIPNPTDKILGALPTPSTIHLPDLDCFRAQRIMFLGRFLVLHTHLLPGDPRLARVWLILDLARNRCLDSENQDTIDNSLWWRYLQFEWQQVLGAWTLGTITQYSDFTSIILTNLLSLEYRMVYQFQLIFFTSQKGLTSGFSFYSHCPNSFLLSLTPLPTRFCLIFTSFFISEIKLYSIFRPYS